MPIQRLVVVGDAHVGAVPASVEAALLRFLDAVPTLGDGLLVNGDLFGFWFSYRRAIPRAGLRVLVRLAALARSLPVLMTGGNHDRWGESLWERELEIRYGAHELRFALGNQSVLAIHGDGVAEPNWRTALKERLVHHPIVSACYRALPAEFGFWLADRIGGDMERTPQLDRLEVETARLQRNWAEARLREANDCSLLVMGHSHRPAAVEVSPGRRYLNPGAWLDGHRYAVVTESTMELKQYPG